MSKFCFKKYFITGGAGFIGAHLANAILNSSDAKVTPCLIIFPLGDAGHSVNGLMIKD